MLCVCIGRGRPQLVQAEHRHLVEEGAELVELRLDYLEDRVHLSDLLSARPGPVVVSCRRTQDGGKWSGSEEERLILLRQAVAAGAEYVDLEEDIAEEIPRHGATKRIISLHNFRETPQNLMEIQKRLASHDADIVKIATMANHFRDNLRMLNMVRKSKTPTIGLCMGEQGIPSRVLGHSYGSPITYSTVYHERSMAPGQLIFQEMRDVYRYNQIGPDTQIFGVIADPIGHSLSPLIHNTAFAKLGINAVLMPMRVSRSDLDDFFNVAAEMKMRGLAVTIPHKEAIIPKLDEASGVILEIGAANTIVFQEGLKMGYNTDYPAALGAIEEAILKTRGEEEKGEAPQELDLTGKTALVLGSGGVGMTIASGLMRRNAKVVVTDGARPRALALGKRLGAEVVDWDSRHSVPSDILVNCTPVGMHPNVNETPYDKLRLRPSMLVFDVVYNPENTLLIKSALEQNCTVVTGVEMFVRQAVLQFKYFTGQDAPYDLMYDVVKKATSAARV